LGYFYLINIFLFLAFLVDLFLCAFVLFKKRNDEVAASFAFITFNVALWTLGILAFRITKDLNTALFWNREFILTASLIASGGVHFSFIFPNKPKTLSLARKLAIYIPNAIILYLVFVPGFLIEDIIIRDWGKESILGSWYIYYGLYFTFYMLWTLRNYIRSYLSTTGTTRLQIKYVIMATLISVTFGAYFNLYLILCGNYRYIWVGPYSSFIWASIITYAIVTYRLMDIKVVITRGGVLAGTYAFIIGIPALVASVGRPWLVGVMDRLWWVPPLGLFAGLALVGPFAALFLIHKIEGKQRERALRAEEHLERTTQGMIEIDSVQRLVKIIPRYLTQFYYSALDIRITHATIFLLDKDRGEYLLKSTSGTRKISLERTLPEKENPIYIWFKKIVPLIIEKRFVRRRELDVLQREDIDFWLKEERLLRLGDYIEPSLMELKKIMVELKAVLCVPSYYQEGLLGFLILGEKERGLFRPQELSLFFRLSRYAGLAIRSAQLSQDLQQAYASVAQADRLSSMGQLAASFAHEINNPVAIIISGIELSLATMREDLLKAQSVEEKEKIVEYTEDKLIKIKDEAFRISHIIDRIMGYVKAPMGDFTSVRLEDLIEATLGLVEHPLRKNQINVVKEIPKDLPKIRGIAGELQEVFLNLFNNALEAMEDETPGSINILARAFGNPEVVEIKVSDTGGGISPENLRKIFDFLFTTKLQGTGVGLSVVYNIIKKHDGTIDVESEMGKGTTFTMRLPMWKEEGVIKR